MALTPEQFVKVMNVALFGYSPTSEVLSAGLTAYNANINDPNRHDEVYDALLKANGVERTIQLSASDYVYRIYENLLKRPIDQAGHIWWTNEAAKYPEYSLGWKSIPIAMYEAMPDVDKAWVMANTIPTLEEMSKIPFSVKVVREPTLLGDSNVFIEVTGKPNVMVDLLVQGIKNGKPLHDPEIGERIQLDSSGKGRADFTSQSNSSDPKDLPDALKIQAYASALSLNKTTVGEQYTLAAKKFTDKAVSLDIFWPSAATITLPEGVGTSNNPLVYSEDFTIKGTAEAGSTVRLYSDDGKTILATSMADSSGKYTLKVSASKLALTDGQQKEFMVVAVDKAGNAAKEASSIYIAADLKGPDAPVINTQIPSITNKALDTFSGKTEAGAEVKLYFTGREVGKTVADTSGNWTVKIDTSKVRINDGVHKITVQATDAAGNKSAMSAPIEMQVDTRPPNAPALNSKLSEFNKSTPSFQGQGEAGSIVSIYAKDGQGTVTKLADNILVGTDRVFKAVSSVSLNDGDYTFYAKASDKAGNVSKEGYAIKATLDTLAPNAPTIIGSDEIVSNKGRVQIKGSSESGSTVTLHDASGTQVAATKVGTNGTFVVTTPALNDGKHTISLKVVDKAGNASLQSTKVDILVDTKRVDKAGFEVIKSNGADSMRLDAGDIIKFNFTEPVTNIRGYTVAGGYKVAATNPKIEIAQDGMSASLTLGSGETFSSKLPDGAKFGITLIGVTDAANNIGNIIYDGLTG